MSTTVTYKGSTLTTVNNNTKTLKTAGKYMEGDVVLTDISSSSPTIQSLIITPSESQQTFDASSVDGYKPVTVGAISSTYVGSGITRRNSEDSNFTIDTKTYEATGKINVKLNAPAGYYESNASKISQFNITSITNLPTQATTTITPSESSQVAASANTWLTGDITVSAISSTYIGSGITQRDSDDLTGALNTSTYDVTVPVGYYASDGTFSITRKSSNDLTASVIAGYLRVNIPEGYYVTSSKPIIKAKTSDDLTVSGATVAVPAGYYEEAATKSVSSMTLPTSAASSATSGYTSKATISRSTSDQYINIAPGYNSAGGYYKISAVANGSATPAASISGTSATITTGTNTITLTKSVSNTPQVTAGYVSSGTAGNSSVSLTASVTVNPTPTASGATVTIPAGYYSSQTTKSVNSGSASAPTSISGTSATVSTGTNTLTFTKTVSVTPVVSAGYVSSGTATNSSVSLTASVTTKAAATITPGTTNQTIASGTYLTGTQTIAGDADLVASNIINGVQIFGVTGNVVLQNYYTGSSAPSSSLGQNGDIYIQQ